MQKSGVYPPFFVGMKDHACFNYPNGKAMEQQLVGKTQRLQANFQNVLSSNSLLKRRMKAYELKT